MIPLPSPSSTNRVAWLYDLDACRGPTGVTRHALAMRDQLKRRPDVELQVVTGRFLTDEAQTDWSRLDPARRVRLPLGTRDMLRYWRICARPALESWTGPLDWIYCPAEYFVRARRARVAVTSHDILQDLTIAGPRRQALLKRVIPAADAILSVSRFNTERLLQSFPHSASRIHEVPNAADDLFFQQPSEPQRAAVRRDLDLPDDMPYLLCVANFQPRKNLPFLVQAVAQLPEIRQGELALILVGEGDPAEKAAIQTQIQAAGDKARILMPGYRQGPALRALYAEAMALVFPSHCESFGIPAVEAMAQGCPVLLADSTALPEIAGEAGWYFAPDNLSELVETLRQMMDQPTERLDRIAIGKKRANRYRWDEAGARLAEALGLRTYPIPSPTQ